MYPLILKDILLLKKLILLILGFILFFFFLENSSAFAIAVAGFAFIQNSGSFDDRSRSDLMWNSLPISRSKIVSAKYITVLLFGLFVIGIVILFQVIMHFLLNMYEQPFPEVNQIMVGFLTMLIAGAIYYPIYYKFGEKYARILLMIIMFGIIILGNIVWYVVQEEAEKVIAFFSQNSSEQLVVYGIVVTVLLYGISWALSIKVYNAKDF